MYTVSFAASAGPATVPDPDERAFGRIEERGTGPPSAWRRCVFVDGIYLKRSWGGSVENVAA